MTCGAMDEMKKAMEELAQEEKRLLIIRRFYRTSGYSLDELLDKLDIPNEKRAEYARSVIMTEAYEQLGRICSDDPVMRIFKYCKRHEPAS